MSPYVWVRIVAFAACPATLLGVSVRRVPEPPNARGFLLQKDDEICESGADVKNAKVTCSREPVTEFTANKEGKPQVAPCSICDVYNSTRGWCVVKYDVPDLCAGTAGKACPLLFVIGPGDIDNIKKWASPDIHKSGKFIGVYVQGDVESKSGCPGWVPSDTDFIKSTINMFKDTFGWDGRHYAYGFSKGAMMNQIIAVDGTLGFTGISTASTQLQSEPAPDFTCTVPIAYLSLHGDADDVTSYDGGATPWGEETLMSEPESNQKWAEINGCDETPTTESLAAQLIGGDDTSAEHQVWSNCPKTAPVEHYKVLGGDHSIAKAIDDMSLLFLAAEFFTKVESACEATPDDCPGPRPATCAL